MLSKKGNWDRETTTREALVPRVIYIARRKKRDPQDPETTHAHVQCSSLAARHGDHALQEREGEDDQIE